MRINQIPEEQKKAEGRFIESRMKELGITQDEIADELGLTQGTISKWCKGIKPINEKRLLWLAARLNFNASELRPGIVGADVLNSGNRDAIAEKAIRFLNLAQPSEKAKLEALLDAFLVDIEARQNTHESNP